MAAWRSAPGHERRPSLADWAIASLAVWLGALPLGAAMVALSMLVNALLGASAPDEGAHPLVVFFVTGYILLFSHMFSWIGLLLPGFVTLLAVGYGILAALAFRWILKIRRPEIFRAH